MIYLAHESNRIPILMPFMGHESQFGGPPLHDLAVSDVFDLRLASAHLGGMPIVELHELVAQDYQQHRHKVTKFDGEFEQEDASGRTLVPGDLIVAEPAGQEILGCWNYALTHGRPLMFGQFNGENPLVPPHVVTSSHRHVLLSPTLLFSKSAAAVSQLITPHDRRPMGADPQSRLRQ